MQRVLRWEGVKEMSFKNPDRLKKDKNKVKKVTHAPKIPKKVKAEKKPKQG